MNTKDIVKLCQSVGDNKTSHQNFAVLDALLLRALQPLEAETPAFREWAAEVLLAQVTSRRAENPELVNACVGAMLGRPNSSQALIGAGLDRGAIFNFVGRVTELGSQLENAQVEHCRRHGVRVSAELIQDLKHAHNELGLSPRLVVACRTSAYWLQEAATFKGQIVDHFLRLLYKHASRSEVVSGKRVSLDDAFQGAYVAIYVAVNMFRSSKGAFGSYIGKWLMMSNRESASHSMGLAVPGKRMRSEAVLQSIPLENADSIGLEPVHEGDQELISRISAVANDPDIRAVLWLADAVSPTVGQVSRA